MPATAHPATENGETVTQQQLRQATAVAIGNRGILIEGPPGSGKTSLALSLIDRGAVLIGDDGVSIGAAKRGLKISSAPNTSGLIEVRNVGLVEYPCTTAYLALALTLTDDAPRFVEKASSLNILDQAVPHLQFARYNEADPIRAEIALERYGLLHAE